MFDMSAVELALFLMVFGGLFAGIFLAVRLSRRPSQPTDTRPAHRGHT